MQLAINCLDILPAGQIQILGQRGAGRVEEAPVHGIRIRTSNQTQRRDMVSRNHSRIARMELGGPSMARQLRRDRIDPLGHDQDRSIDRFRKEVPQRAVETACQHDSLAILSDEGKGPLEIEHSGNVASEHSTSSVGFVNRSGSW